MTARRLVTFAELKETYGIVYCRVHLRRLMHPNRKQFPQCVTTVSDRGRGRIFWWSDEIETYLAGLPKPVYKTDEDDE